MSNAEFYEHSPCGGMTDVLIIWTADVRNDQIPAESNTTFAFAPLIASHITVIKQCLANDMIKSDEAAVALGQAFSCHCSDTRPPQTFSVDAPE